MKQEQTAAQHLIGLIDQVAKDVKAGKCANTNDVLKRISEGMGYRRNISWGWLVCWGRGSKSASVPCAGWAVGVGSAGCKP